MGMHLSVRVVFGAVFTLKELKKASRKDIIYMDESEHPHLAHGSENDGDVHYMWVKGTHQHVASEGGGTRHVQQPLAVRDAGVQQPRSVTSS